MEPLPSTFEDFAREVLRRYLRSAVIIDDQWPDLPFDEPTDGEPDESALIDESKPEGEELGESGGALAEIPPPLPERNPEDSRLLGRLHRALLEEGVLACGFRYTHRLRATALELAKRADIVVLDWHLVGDDGAEALEILEELKGGHLRFVCIFTGHARSEEVRRALEARLGKVAEDTENRPADLRIENLVIAIRNKAGIIEEASDLTVEPDELLDVAARGLSNNYNGLVQLAMLELTQEHRRQLPAILKRFDKAIDPAVLLEAGAELSPIGQGGAFLEILVDEWRAHLELGSSNLQVIGATGRQLFGAKLAGRLEKISQSELQEALARLKIKTGVARDFSDHAKKPPGVERVRQWLTSGCDGPVPAVHGKFKPRDEPLAGWGVLSAISGANDETTVVPLLRLDALFHQRLEQPSELTQGTVIAICDGKEERRYYLCITPACDAVRPDRLGNLFTFLRTVSIPKEQLFDKRGFRRDYFVVEHESELLCLRVLVKQRIVVEVSERTFDKDGALRGSLPLESRGTASTVHLIRIAQLRFEHALSITASAAADASRIGVNRVELVRSLFS